MIALLRLGRREAWQHKARSTLVLLLILIPVALSAAVLALVPAFSADPALHMTLELGAAQARVTMTDDASLPAEVPWEDPGVGGAVRVLDAATLTLWAPVGDAGLVTGIGAEQVDTSDPMLAPKYSAAAGRLPRSAGEVALDRSSLRRLGIELGDTVSFSMPQVALRVVGVVAGGTCTDCPLAVLAPGSVERPVLPSEADPFPAEWTSVSWRDAWYLDGVDAGVLARMELQQLGGTGWRVMSHDQVDTSGDDPTVGRAWTVAGAAFLLLWTGLVAASGLAVGARRRKRELGLLAANGADPARLRVAVVAEGLVLGALGAALGVAVGIVAARLIEPHVRIDELPRGLSIPWAWLLLVWAVGTLAAVVAAWSASVGVATLTPAQLLRGHRPTPRPAPAWFAAGLVLFVGGCVVLRVGREMFDDGYGDGSGDQVVIALGVLATTLGVVAVVVGATRIAGRLTGAASTGLRLAGRDLARHGVRIAAATAAVALTLTGAIVTATYGQSNSSQSFVEQALADTGPVLHGGPERVGLLIARESRLVDGRVLPLTVDDSTVDALETATHGVGTVTKFPAGPAVQRCFAGFPDAQGNTVEDCQPIVVATADDRMLELLPPQVADRLRDGHIVTNGGTLRDAAGAELPTTVAYLALWSDDGAMSGTFGGADAVVTEATADALGVDRTHPFAVEAFVVLDDIPDEAALERVVDDLGFTLTEGAWAPPTELRWSEGVIFAVAAAAVAFVTLLIVMITLALVRVESRSDDDVLLIAGASPGLSRRVSAARAGMIVVLAALPSVIAGWSVARSLMIGGAPVPWAAIALALVALPLIAASMGWLFHRPPRRLTLR